MAKTTFSHDINDEIIQLFNETCEIVGGHKYRILEAAIEAYSVMPWEYQHMLSSVNQEKRKFYLDMIRTLGVPPARPKSSIRAKSLKSG